MRVDGMYHDRYTCALFARVFRDVLERADAGGHALFEPLRVRMVEVVECVDVWTAQRIAAQAGSPEVPGSTSAVESVIVSAMMTTREVAARLGCGTRNVRDLAQRGTLRGVPTKRGLAFDSVEIERYVEERGAREVA